MNASINIVNDNFSTGAPAGSAPRRKWVLTQEAFDRFLASLGEDRDAAGERYLEIRGNLVRFFQWRGCPFPEDHADETINRIAKRMAEREEIRDPASYSLGVARMLLLEINRERVSQQQFLSELTNSEITPRQPDESEASLDCLRNCLQRLSPENRELILQYYQGEKGSKIESRKKLAERFGIPVNTLRMRALRIRETLQESVKNCQKKCQDECVSGFTNTQFSPVVIRGGRKRRIPSHSTPEYARVR